MENRSWLLFVLASALAATGCREGCSGTGDRTGAGSTGAADAAPMDTDRDGVPDHADPTPQGSSHNKLNGTYSGGAATVVAITATLGDGTENMELVYDDDLTTGCDRSWDPQGALCDEAGTTDSPTTSTKSEADSGASWSAGPGLEEGAPAPVTGFLVVDACSNDSCTAVDFNEARVFQMYSDGKTTDLRVSIHPERGDTAPSWDDPGWVTVTDFAAIGPGTSLDDYVVKDPTVIATGPQVTRYVRFEARTDGSLDDGDYIELRSVKLFSVSALE